MRRRAGRRGSWRRALALAVAAALLLVVGVALVRADTVERLLHPGRYAVSGAALRPADSYVAAARGAVGRGERVAALAFPRGIGPVTVSIVSARDAGPRRTVYLDPPSARVLAIVAARGGFFDADGAGTSPPARPAQSVARVIARARSIGGGGEVARVEWPTTRTPDWTVRFAGRAGRRVKVADDSASAPAVLAREQGGPAAFGGWLIVAGGVATVVGAMFVMRSKRRGARAPARP